MKAVIVFMLLFAAVYCHPVKRSASSSESADVQPVETQSLKVSAVSDVSSEEDDDDANDDDDSDSDESDETTSPPPVIETTLVPITDGRGDNMGYHSDYKKHIYYVDGNNVEKEPSAYKSYGSDKTGYDGADLKVYKALQVQNVGLDQGLDSSSGTESDDMSQQEQKAASTSTASDASPSQESDENSQSSEEGTTGATTTENNSSESSESEETIAADQPAEVKSKDPNVVVA